MVLANIDVLIPGTLTACAALVAAWASLRNGRRMKTSNGRSIGRLAEDNARSLKNLSKRVEVIEDRQLDMRERQVEMQEDDLATREIVVGHVRADEEQFQAIRVMVSGMARQNAEAVGVAATLAEDTTRVATDLADKVATDVATTRTVHERLLAHDEWERDALGHEIAAEVVARISETTGEIPEQTTEGESNVG